MKARDLVGRKIVRIEQTRVETNTGWAYNLDAIYLDNGTRLRLSVSETPEGAEYVVVGTVYKSKPEPEPKDPTP